jgi:AraC-like DNA-binding protein
MENQQVLNDTLFAEPDLPLTVQFRPQTDLHHHMHTFRELVMVTGGSGTHVFNDERYPITVGDVFVIPPYTPHGYAHTIDLTIYNILFKEQMFDRFRDELELIPGFHGLIYLEPYYRSVRGFAGRLTLAPDQIVQAMSLINRLEHETVSSRDGRSIMIETLFIELLLFYCRRFSEDDGPATRVMPVARTIGYMNRHFAETLELDDLVRISGLSKRSLIRHFTNTTGFSPMRYLQRIRVAKAQLLLKRGDESITQIALESGFNDSAYFSAVFKKHTQVSPSEFQRTTTHS